MFFNRVSLKVRKLKTFFESRKLLVTEVYTILENLMIELKCFSEIGIIEL